MTTFQAPASPPEAPEEGVGEAPPAPGGRRGLSSLQIAVLVAAIAFLGAAVGFVVGQRSEADPLSATDVGYLQDMGYHHEQAVQMSLLLLDKDGIDRTLRSFAQEIIVDQRYEQGVFVATLDRFGHDTSAGDTVMGWMGEAQPIEDMVGIATDAQIEELRAAEGTEAEALWIALMSEHHLAGLHMADWEARHGSDRTVVNLAKATVKNQRSEVLDIARYRRSHDIPIPDGFDDPTQDQRLNPLSFTDPGD
ncbi:MAG: DUF305 domain-containing protein [Acidimicrobiales bacterium]